MGETKGGRKVALLSALVFAVLVAILAWVNWAWIPFLLEFERLGRNVQGYHEYRHRRTGVVFVRLPGGLFNMGSPESDPDHSTDEGPVHAVSLSPFLIAKHEVTHAQWEQVMGSHRSESPRNDLPVEQVTWEECQEFCAATGFSLPTETQWEYACRAGTTTPFAFGEVLTTKQARFNARGTVAVDSFQPNGFGLHNMHGNVWEWCEDVFDPEFYKRTAATRKNPVCTLDSLVRVTRGGCWFSHASGCRSAYRGGSLLSHRSSRIGFRPTARTP